MYVILTYLQRKFVNYNLFMLFETEKLHLKTFCMGTPFSIAKWTKMSKNVPIQKNENKKTPTHFFFFF